MELENLVMRANAEIIWWRLKYSLDEIKEKHPDRKDLIGPMTESLSQMGDIIEFLRYSMKEMKEMQFEIMDLRVKNASLNLENEKVKIQNRNLLEQVEL